MGAFSLSSRRDVKPLPGALCMRFDCGGTVLAGQAVYLDTSGDVNPAEAVTSTHQVVVGIAVADNDGGTSFATGDRIDVCVFGPLAGFSSLGEGTLAYCGTLAGQIETANPGSGNYKYVVGVAFSSTIVFVNPYTDNIAQLTS